MIRVLPAIVILCLAAPVAAAPTMQERLSYYPVSGRNLGELRRDMAQNGPNGFWGYTRWYVEWTGSCDVSLRIDITMPQLADPARLSAPDLQVWRRMEAALLAHERQHAGHGIAAAREIHAANCSNAQAIIRKWARQDKVLDRQTQHGRTQGVQLD